MRAGPGTKPFTWARHVVAGAALRTVATELSSQGIPVLPVKGIVTAATLYDHVAERPIQDVDVRLRRVDYRRAVCVARARGWHKKHVVLLGQVLWLVDGIEFDVKSELGPPGLCALSVDSVIERAVLRTGSLGFPHLEPEWNDHALILVLNVFKDGLSSAPWAIEDLRRATAHPEFDPRVLIARARVGRVATALWIVSDWMAQRQGAPVWRAIRDGLGARPPSRRAADVYALWLRLGRRRRVAHFMVPIATDGGWRSVAALGMASAGLLRGYGLKAVDALRAAGPSRK
jgi:hypothetical protein